MARSKKYKKPVVKRKQARRSESDGQYLLKLVLVVLPGSFWLRFGAPLQVGSTVLTAVPVGVLAGLGFISYFEHFQSDRKIWYAVLIVIGILTYFVPAGIVL